MNRRLSVRLPEGLARGIEALAQRSGKSKSEIVRDALKRTGVGLPRSAESRAEVLRRAAALRARQNEVVDAAALIRESRNELERRGQREIPVRRSPACRGRREPPLGRVTAGFQRTPLA